MTFNRLAEHMTVFDLKKAISQRCGFPIDMQMLKLGALLLTDTHLIKQIPSDESQRFPEKAVHIS
jgi:catalase